VLLSVPGREQRARHTAGGHHRAVLELRSGTGRGYPGSCRRADREVQVFPPHGMVFKVGRSAAWRGAGPRNATCEDSLAMAPRSSSILGDTAPASRRTKFDGSCAGEYQRLDRRLQYALYSINFATARGAVVGPHPPHPQFFGK